MDKLLIRGGRRLAGEVTISGAKNAALPELCAALLTAEPVHAAQRAAPAGRGDDAQAAAHTWASRPSARRQRRRRSRSTPAASPRPRRRTSWSRRCARRSWCSARCWRASARRASRCRAAARSARGRSTSTSRACRRWAPRSRSSTATSSPRAERLKGARITTDMVTVTGTENLLMAATLADGETVLENAAQEPEVPDLAEMLIAMGARIEGHGTEPHPHRRASSGCTAPTHRIVPDRIEAGTFLCAVAAAGGDVVLRGARADHLDAVIDKLREAGATIEAGDDWIRVRADGRPQRGELPHQRVPGVPDRHAGAVHGARLHRRGHARASPRRSSRTASCTSTSWCAWARTSRSTATPRSCTACRGCRARP